MSRGRVLVTADGPHLRDPLVAIRALAAEGYRSSLAISCGSSVATASKYCDRIVHVPSCLDSGYRTAIASELERGGYLTLLPASEAALLALGVSTPHLVNKVTLGQRGESVGVPAPPTRVFLSRQELLRSAGELDYPVIVKPAIHHYNASRVDTRRDLTGVEMQAGPVMVQPYLGALNAISGVVWEGRLVAATHERWLRIWKYYCGVASAAETVAPDEDRETGMLRLLEGYQGIFHAQFAGPYLLDLNLRIHTSHPLSVAAGVNIAAIQCDLLRGESVPEVRARPGVFFRWLEGDCRHLARAVRERSMSLGTALAALRPHPGAAHSTESIRDPGPMLARGWYLLRTAAGRAVRRDRVEESSGSGIDGLHFGNGRGEWA